MIADPVCRLGKYEDMEAILGLFGRCGYTHGYRYLQWMNYECPFGAAVTHVLESGSRILGHYCVVPMELAGPGDATLMGGLAAQFMMDPAFRSVELARTLALGLYAECANRGIQMVYGFPNSNSSALSFRLLRWIDLGDRVEMTLPVSGFTDGFVGNVAIADHSDSVPEATGFWSELVGPAEWTVRRSDLYFRWRLQRPGADYCFVANDSGYAFWKLHRKSNGQVLGHILDFRLRSRVLNSAVGLLLTAVATLRRRGAGSVTAWVPRGPVYEPVFLAAGFSSDGPTTHCGVKLLGEGGSTRAELTSFDVVMADSDVY